MAESPIVADQIQIFNFTQRLRAQNYNIESKQLLEQSVQSIINLIISEMSKENTLDNADDSRIESFCFHDTRFRVNTEQFGGLYLENIQKLNTSSSLPTLAYYQQVELQELQKENQQLRNQIKSLKKELKMFQSSKKQEMSQKQKQIDWLKNLVEKSFYSFRKIEEENLGIKTEFKSLQESFDKLQSKVLNLEDKNSELVFFIEDLKREHQKETDMIWERVSHLQKNLECVVALIQEDRREWKDWKDGHFSRSRVRSSRKM